MSNLAPLPERPKQARSIARRLSLVEYGAELFNTRDLDELSIAEITGGVGFSTGSFYSYFADKAELFIAVQQLVAERQDAKIADHFADSQKRGLADRLRLAVDFSITYFRAETGLIRSALRYERRIPQGWAPNRNTTARVVEATVMGLDAADTERLQVAIQLSFGLLVNALLHDPGPLHLDDPALADKIFVAMTPYLEDTKQS